MNPPTLPGWLRNVLAALLPVLGTLVNLLLQLGAGTAAPSLAYFPMLVIAALWRGRGPAWVALAISAAFVTYFWLTPPVRSRFGEPSDFVFAMTTFLVASVMVVEVAARARRLKRRADRLAQARQDELSRLEAAEAANRETQARLEVALEAGAMGTWEYHVVTRRLLASERTRQIVGASRSEGSLERLLEHVHSEDRDRLVQGLEAAVRDGAVFDAGFRVVIGEETRYVSVQALRVSDSRAGVRFVGVAKDVTQERAALREAQIGREELERVFDLLPIALAVDPRADHIRVSDSLREILRLEPLQDASSSGPHRRAIPYRQTRNGVELPADELPMQVAAREGRDVRNAEVDIEFADGAVRSLLISAAPLFDAEGRLRGAIGTHVDVTALKEAERALMAADRQKDEFLATLAHELRNPMAPIRYAAAMLRPGMTPESLLQARAMIERQSAHMSRLLDDLLDLSRVTRNVIQLQREVVDLRAIVREAVDGCRPAIEAAQHEVHVVLPDSPLWVDGDHARLVQIVGNLVGNAVKYTDPGGTVTVETGRAEERVRVVVRDTGAGFEPGRAGQLFRLFSQLHPALEASRGGLGIGLAIVRRLVELHGGSIRAASDGPGRGATFTVELPVAPPPSRIAETPRPARFARKGQRVLIVDDNRDAADALGLLLELSGFEVQCAYDGATALERAGDFQPEVVLLDLGLPDVDGREVCLRLREARAARSAKIVAITGWGRAEDRRATLAAGFDAHLVKPVDPDRLLRLLAGLLEAEAASPAAEVSAPAQAGSS